MTKTENYQLPQWEAADPVRREDFNRAMANIEEGLSAAYSSNREPIKYQRISIKSANVAGDILEEYDGVPKFVIVYGTYGSAFVSNGGLGNIMVSSTSVNSDYKITLKLSGAKLSLYYKGASFGTQILDVAAFF